MMCKVMGIVNVTPDSFSDGGKYYEPGEAVRRALNLIDEGADIIDLGGESTRPGATPIAWEEEWARVEPVLKELGKTEAVISVDTYHPETAERAIKSGAKIINCVYERSVPEMLRVIDDAAREGAAQEIELVVPASCLSWIESGGEGLAALPRLYLDPMIGFGTTREEDLARLRAIPELATRGRVLVGVSRKRIVKHLTGEKVTGKNLGGNLGLAIWCAMQGASVVRVHDVRETVQALKTLAVLDE